ncbi:alpha-ketoglutarate-dependent dioxygenase AlkB [Acinetobacter sp. MD2(2019)]|uniref:alpha-ketoglutarate-dependent dioxygenase AlkB family protein n=1 Tax=Acinetobacter sp. MD2(2019) TaxID=2605273 RepID=UPI002D1EAC04|nr:alpha-ketoglutarate-dependent dioxygenase AlkB [Acinetobacter sp. MD2(2019)]MEB3753982.1 alpha-ketoglutarate-dependent dioxygenase AlkB [Acinetobacter sp. MD2(2019)]
MQHNLDLFEQDPTENYLPFDGTVEYLPHFLTPTAANQFFEVLLQQVSWQRDEVFVAGKYIQTSRKIAWYADQAFSYHYSGTTKYAKPWLPELFILKQKIEQATGEQFNTCLLNLYHTGAEGLGWHSDSEPEISPSSAIASLSLGVVRKFVFKHRQRAFKVQLQLESGSLLLMKDQTQQYWQHSLPKMRNVEQARMNLTFRKMRDE